MRETVWKKDNKKDLNTSVIFKTFFFCCIIIHTWRVETAYKIRDWRWKKTTGEAIVQIRLYKFAHTHTTVALEQKNWREKIIIEN